MSESKIINFQYSEPHPEHQTSDEAAKQLRQQIKSSDQQFPEAFGQRSEQSPAVADSQSSPFAEHFLSRPKFDRTRFPDVKDLLRWLQGYQDEKSSPYDVGTIETATQMEEVLGLVPQLTEAMLIEFIYQTGSDYTTLSVAEMVAQMLSMLALTGIAAEAVLRLKAADLSGDAFGPQFSFELKRILADSKILQDDARHSRLLEVLRVGVNVLNDLSD